MPTKQIQRFLVVDWKGEKTSLRKTQPNELGPTELVSEVSLTLNVPEIEMNELSAEFDVSEARIEEAVAEQLSLIEPEDEPAWLDVAERKIEEYPIDMLSGGPDHGGAVDALLGQTLREFDGYADPEAVAEYISDRVKYQREKYNEEN